MSADGVLTAWQEFVRGVPVQADVRPMIIASWERTRNEGVSVDQRGTPSITGKELVERLESNSDLLKLAGPYLQWLVQSSATSCDCPRLVLLADAEGIILQSQVGEEARPEGLFGIHEGHDLSEPRIGTNAIGTALETHTPVSVVGAEHYNAEYHTLATYAAPLRDSSGEVMGAVGMVSRVQDHSSHCLMMVSHTAGVISEHMMYRRVAEDPKANLLIARLSSFMAHELSNPLTAIGGCLTLLSRQSLPEAAQGLVGRCQEIVCQMSELVRELKALGGGRASKRPIALAELAEQVVGAIRPPSTYEVEISVPSGLVVNGNRTLLHMALTNLARNAMEAMPAGGRLGIAAREIVGGVRVTVWDDGPGVPPSVQRELFHGTVTTKPQGSGLGLLLVRAVVESAHGGTLSYTPNVPQGSRFNIVLPAASLQVEVAKSI